MSKMYDNITGRSPIATDDLGYIGTGNKASDILSGGGTTDYNDLNNKPTINSVELTGNLTSSDLGLQSELNEAQTNAVNSGITAALTEQISTNKNNISSEQAKTTGMSEGGSNYITVGGIRVYVSATEPTGDIPIGSTWINGSTLKAYTTSSNIFDKTAKNTSNGYKNNYRINGTTEESSSGNYISEYMAIGAGLSGVISGLSTTGNFSSSLCFYNVQKVAISGVQYQNRDTIDFTTPENTAYMRITCAESYEDDVQIKYVSWA